MRIDKQHDHSKKKRNRTFVTDVGAENLMFAHVKKTLRAKNTRQRMLQTKVCEEIHMFAHENQTHTSANTRKRKFKTDACVEKKLTIAHESVTNAQGKNTVCGQKRTDNLAKQTLKQKYYLQANA